MVDLREAVLVPTQAIKAEEFVGTAACLKSSDMFLVGVSKLGSDFEVFRYGFGSDMLFSSKRIHDYSPISFDYHEGIYAVVGYYRCPSTKEETMVLHLFDQDFKLITTQDLDRPSKFAQVKIQSLKSETPENALQMKLSIVSGFENPAQIFKLTYNPAHSEKRFSWQLS